MIPDRVIHFPPDTYPSNIHYHALCFCGFDWQTKIQMDCLLGYFIGMNVFLDVARCRFFPVSEVPLFEIGLNSYHCLAYSGFTYCSVLRTAPVPHQITITGLHTITISPTCLILHLSKSD
jgi:hypothetical protein